MAKKPKQTKQEKYDEGFVRGKRACLIGIFPIFIFLGFMLFGSWLIYDYYNKMTVNQDNSDVCSLVRKHYAQSLKPNYPCDLADKGDHWLVSFNENPGSTSSAPVFMSFKVAKKDNAISAGYNVN